MMKIIPIMFLSIVLFIAAVNDLFFHKIPNLLTFPAAGLGILFHTWTNGWNGLFFSLKGLFLGLALLMLFYILGGTGAGDVKLLGAVGSFLGTEGVFVAFFFTAIIGGIYAFLLMAVAGWLPDMIKRYAMMLKMFICTRSFTYMAPPKERKRPVLCYGVVIALGTFLSIIKTL